jgi:ABC-type polar amino acid transport system ATPase subunit
MEKQLLVITVIKQTSDMDPINTPDPLTHRTVAYNANEGGAPLLRVCGLTKRFGQHVVLTDVSLDVFAHEVVVLIGPSGAGKSTLLRSINLLETPDRGEIEFDGVTYFRRSDEGTPDLPGRKTLMKLRQDVGMVFQHINLFPHRTILQNVSEGPIWVQRRPKAEVTAEAEAILARFGLKDRAHYYPSQLSGGQQQRAAICRAVIMKPKLMLFDEPTASLDPELVGEVLIVMKELASDGMGMVVVTHEMGFAREVAHRIVFLDGGVVLEQASPEELFLRPQHDRARQFIAKITDPLKTTAL